MYILYGVFKSVFGVHIVSDWINIIRRTKKKKICIQSPYYVEYYVVCAHCRTVVYPSVTSLVYSYPEDLIYSLILGFLIYKRLLSTHFNKNVYFNLKTLLLLIRTRSFPNSSTVSSCNRDDFLIVPRSPVSKYNKSKRGPLKNGGQMTGR